MKRRILSIFMCLCMTLCLLPTAALAEGITQYDIWVGGVRVTSENASGVTGPGITGTVSYANGTLTLSGASITGAYTDSNSHSAAIYASTALTVILTGVNTAVGPYTASGYSYGVYCYGALAINGSGSLNAVGGAETGPDGSSYGVYGGSSVTISGNTKVTATGGSADGNSYGVYGKCGVNISDATVTAAGGEAGGTSCGVWGYGANVGVSISSSAKVTATGGKAGSSSFGVYGGNSSVDVSVSDSATVTAMGGEAGETSCGVWGSYNVSVTGGVVNATGGAAMGTSGVSCGVFGSTINVNNESGSGLLIAKGGSTTTSSAANIAPTCGADSALLTGAAGEDFAVWGEKGVYYVLDGAETNSRVADGILVGHTKITEDSAAGLDLTIWPDSADSSHWDNTTGGWKTEMVGGVNTLTLKNVIINVPDNSSGAYGIQLPESAAVNIVLEGVNVVSAGAASSGHSYGIHGGSDIGSSGGSVTISSTNGGALYTLAGTASGVSCGVYGGDNLSISGTVTAIGGMASSVSCGACSGDISLSGTVTVIGAAASGASFGLYGNSNSGAISLSGTVTAIGGTATNVSSCGVYSKGTISVTDGALTATGGTTSADSCGVFGYSDVSVSGGVVTTTGGTAMGTYSGSCGMFGGTVTISGTVTATGGTAHYTSYGVSGGDGGISLSDTVIATGGMAGRNSYGVYSTNGTIIISGTVTATGGAASTVSCGVYRFSGSVSVTGGTATAFSGTVGSSGNSQAMSPAPDFSSYTGAGVVASANADGSSPASYDANNIATYKYLKIGTLYALTINLNGGSGATTSNSYLADIVIPIEAGTKSGYTFSGWTATGGGTFANASSASTTYTMPACAAAITANWTAKSSGGGDSGASTTTVPVSGGSGAVNLSASVSGSTATVS
ncbi:MAG: InlB B-repeat-containing protein, partial [Lawsonibacter sp.]|nr:InlB B-repeat-containing protein [Lawsonibacter sp.]